MTKPTNEQSDQNGLELALEATKDLIDGGVPLGEISARATKPIADLLESIERFAAGVGFDSHLASLYRTLGGWAQSVEARLSESESARAQSRPSPLSQEDATTAALERSGEALAEQHVAPQPDTCSRCGKPGKITGRMRLCDSCAASWRAPAIRVPLAQSPWVPGDATDETNESHEHEPGTDAFAPLHSQRFKAVGIGAWRAQQQRIRELEAEVTELTDTIAIRAARTTELEAEVELLKVANAALAVGEPSNRVLIAKACIQALMAATDEWRSGREPSDAAVRRAAMSLRDALLDCGKQERIEFSVKEVLP